MVEIRRKTAAKRGAKSLGKIDRPQAKGAAKQPTARRTMTAAEKQAVQDAKRDAAAELGRRYQAGATIVQLSAETGATRATIRRRLSEAGVPMRKVGQRLSPREASQRAERTAMGATRRATRQAEQAAAALERQRRRASAAELAASIGADYRAGASLVDLAIKYSRNRQTIRNILAKAGVAPRPTSREVLNIKALARRYEAGESLAELRKDAGLSPMQLRARLAEVGVQIRTAGGGGPKVPRYEYNGESLTLTEWAVRTGLTRSALQSRPGYGWSVERALTTPAAE